MDKKKDSVLGDHGQAISQAFGGIGKQVKKYSDWRKKREERIQSKKKPAKKTKYIPASKRPADMKKGQVYGQDSKSTGRNWSKPYGQKSNKPSSGDPKTWKKAASKPKPTPKPSPKPKPTKKPTPSKPTTSTKKPTPSSAAQNLRSGRTPDKAPTKPAKKVYGSKGRKDLKQSSRMAAALKDLKVRKYKK